MKSRDTAKAEKPSTLSAKRPKSVKPARVRHDAISSEVLSMAAELFSRKGIAATSIQDISDAVGISRPALYYYFGNKAAILDELVRGTSKTPVALFDSLEAEKRSPAIARIRVAARGLVLWVLDPQSHFNLVDRFEIELPEMIARTNREAKRRVLSGMTTLVESAIRRGEIRAVHPRIAAFAIIGMCNWTTRWFSSEGKFSPKEIAEMIADFAVNSLRRSSSDGSRASVKGLTSEIRQHLDLIDLLATRKESSS